MWLDTVLAWLITFGISFSMAVTDGPLGLFKANRRFFSRKFGSGHWLAIGVGCPICLSLYAGIPITFFMGGSYAMWLSSFGFVAAVTSLSPPDAE
jgi:hypothetical protein